MYDLKPCKYCGSIPMVYGDPVYGYHAVCEGYGGAWPCPVHPYTGTHRTEEGAIAEWNERFGDE